MEGKALCRSSCIEMAVAGGSEGFRGLAEDLKLEVARRGLSLVGITSPDRSLHGGFYRGWIGDGLHGEMAYLAREDSMARREDLRGTMDTVRSVVVVGQEYGQDDPPGLPGDRSRGVVARYARGQDYHEVLKGELLGLLGWLEGLVEGDLVGRAYVDTGPILERELARRAGLGWFGRNTMMINPGLGSYFFLGVLLLDIELPFDAAFEEDRCGTCRACLDACPTGALLGRDADGAPQIDARRCISYLTIELRGAIPASLRSGIGNRVFGCDICQEVCPWNGRFARAAREPAYEARSELDGLPLMILANQLLTMDDEEFREFFKGSPVRRAKRVGLLRNVCVALGNWGSDDAVPVLSRALDDPAPLVRGHAAWALGMLAATSAGGVLSARLRIEGDDWVTEEIEQALQGPSLAE